MIAKKPSFFNTLQLETHALKQELSDGLLNTQAHCSPKFLYDVLGSTLFDAITHLPEYYPTRTEAAIFAKHDQAIHAQIPTEAAWIDLGAGNCQKAAKLFTATPPGIYIAVDISLDYLTNTLTHLQFEHPHVTFAGVGMDFSNTLEFPQALQQQMAERPIFVFYPGSSLGNFNPTQAFDFLKRIASVCKSGQQGSGLLIGIDLVKDQMTLEQAYDDSLGVTAAFNLNALRHINTLIGSDFDVRDWQHCARFNTQESRIEMHLQARSRVTVSWGDHKRVFEEKETIHTENSYKWTITKFTEYLNRAGFSRTQHWTDDQDHYALFWANS